VLWCETVNPVSAVSAVMTASSYVVLYVQNNSRKQRHLEAFTFKGRQGKGKDTEEVTQTHENRLTFTTILSRNIIIIIL